MRNKSNTLQYICGAGSQLSWMYAWTSFLIFSFFQRFYPLPEAVGIFGLASILTLAYQGRRWRIIQILLLQTAGFTISALWVVYEFYDFTGPWWGLNWLGEFFKQPRGRGDWMLLIFVTAYTILFYVMGTRFVRENRSYRTAGSRFDRGLMAFFGLFLLKLVIKYRLDIEFNESMSYLMIFPFLVFSLMEIGLARNPEADHNRRFLSGYHVIGLSASFIAGTFIIGAGIFTFFLPYLNTASEAGYNLMKDAAGPLEPILISIVKFIFGHADWRQSAEGSTSSTGAMGPPASNAVLLWVQDILTWKSGIILIILGVGVASVLLRYLVRWLFRNRHDRSRPITLRSFRSWWYRFKAALLICLQWLFRSRAKRTAIQYYTALQRWGRFSGFAHRKDETPREYGNRLSRQFPLLSAEFMLIIEMLHQEVYGNTTLDAKQIERIRRSWKNLLRPSKWPMRIKAVMANT